jgi:hypothetical protein
MVEPPQDAADRDAVVLVEGAVLGGDVGLLDGLRHLLQVHGLAVAVLHGDAVELGLAVGVVDDRDLLVGEVVGLRDGDLVVGHHHADDAEHEEDGCRDRAPLEGADEPLPPAGAALAVTVVEAGTAATIAVAVASGSTLLGRQLGSADLAPALRHNLLHSPMRPEKPSRAATQYDLTGATTPKRRTPLTRPAQGPHRMPSGTPGGRATCRRSQPAHRIVRTTTGQVTGPKPGSAPLRPIPGSRPVA